MFCMNVAYMLNSTAKLRINKLLSYLILCESEEQGYKTRTCGKEHHEEENGVAWT